MDRETDGHISLTGPHRAPADPSVGINSSQPWTPTLVIVIVIVNIASTKTIEYKYKIVKVPRRTSQADGLIILPLRSFDPMACSRMHCAQLRAVRVFAKKRWGRTDRQRYRETGTQTHKIYWNPLWSFRPLCGDKCIVTLDPHTGNINSNSNHL